MEACLCNVDVFFNEHLHLKKKIGPNSPFLYCLR